jgi:hypothetical protein
MIFHGKNRVLFNTRWMAFAGFCVAAGFAAHKCYVIAMHQSPKARWIHDADEILPPWTRMALFALVLAVLILNVGQVLLQSGGFERVYVAVFLSEIVLYPIRNLLPDSAALLLYFVQGLADVVMLSAASVLFFTIGTRARPDESLTP